MRGCGLPIVGRRVFLHVIRALGVEGVAPQEGHSVVGVQRRRTQATPPRRTATSNDGVHRAGGGANGRCTARGRDRRWSEDLVKRVLSIQRDDGSWVNEDKKYWEGNPVLATARSVITISHALRAANAIK